MPAGFGLVVEGTAKDTHDARFARVGVQHAAADAHDARWFVACAGTCSS